MFPGDSQIPEAGPLSIVNSSPGARSLSAVATRRLLELLEEERVSCSVDIVDTDGFVQCCKPSGIFFARRRRF